MEFDEFVPPTSPGPVFYIGQHETQRTSPVTLDHLSQGQDLGYNFMSTPLTTTSFHTRVLDQVRKHFTDLESASSHGRHPSPILSSLSPVDTILVPHPSNSSLVGVVSPWIDLSSQDPVIANVSRQVLSIEVAYAAFCGISNVMVHGPVSDTGATQYARAIAEALGLGPYMQVHVLLAASGEVESDHGDVTHLSELSRAAFADDLNAEVDEPHAYGSWELWDVIRTICRYSQKLSLGKSFFSICLSNSGVSDVTSSR